MDGLVACITMCRFIIPTLEEALEICVVRFLPNKLWVHSRGCNLAGG